MSGHKFKWFWGNIIAIILAASLEKILFSYSGKSHNNSFDDFEIQNPSMQKKE